jgi:hypothetical protein
MAMWLIANSDGLDGVYGFMEYLAKYADEEYLRWYARLCRHYCIEGKREQFSTDPYILEHIRNPDFERGLSGWTAQTAEAGSIGCARMDRFGWLEGRYPRSERGDTFAYMRRSAAKPNILTQKIRNLQQGRYYSVKMLVADRNDMTTKQLYGIDIIIDNVEMAPHRSFVNVFHNVYDHWLSEEDERQGKLKWFNYHFKVFRARTDSAELKITDWPNGTCEELPVNQELAFNFIEVEPYFYE